MDKTQALVIANKRLAKIDAFYGNHCLLAARRQGLGGKNPTSMKDPGNFNKILTPEIKEKVSTDYADALIKLHEKPNNKNMLDCYHEIALLGLIIMRNEPFQFEIAKPELNREENAELAILFAVLGLGEELKVNWSAITLHIDKESRNDYLQFMIELTSISDEAVYAIALILRKIGRSISATKAKHP